MALALLFILRDLHALASRASRGCDTHHYRINTFVYQLGQALHHSLTFSKSTSLVWLGALLPSVLLPGQRAIVNRGATYWSLTRHPPIPTEITGLKPVQVSRLPQSLCNLSPLRLGPEPLGFFQPDPFCVSFLPVTVYRVNRFLSASCPLALFLGYAVSRVY